MIKYIQKIPWKFWLISGFITVGSSGALLADETIGSETLKRMSEGAGLGDGNTDSMSTLVFYLKILIALVSVMTFAVIALASKVTNFKLFPKWKSNPINGAIFPIFGFIFFAAIIVEYFYHKGSYLNYSASVHAEQLDPLFWITFLLTGTVFIITQILLFFFSYKYKGDSSDETPFWKKKIALHYADNDKLEKIWTMIPAVGMSVLVLWGAIIWTQVHQDPPKEAINIEVVAEQFQWTVRHSGLDNKLAGHDYRTIGGSNALGVNIKDAAAKDDIVFAEKEIHVPVNTPINFQVRSKDVLHGFYSPQLKFHIYAVPGMPTHFLVTPNITTAEMRKKLNNEKFNFEVACSQLCGAAHYNMRLIVVVHTKEEYNQWLASQKPTFTPEKIATIEQEQKEMEKERKKTGPISSSVTL